MQRRNILAALSASAIGASGAQLHIKNEFKELNVSDDVVIGHDNVMRLSVRGEAYLIRSGEGDANDLIDMRFEDKGSAVEAECTFLATSSSLPALSQRANLVGKFIGAKLHSPSPLRYKDIKTGVWIRLRYLFAVSIELEKTAKFDFDKLLPGCDLGTAAIGNFPFSWIVDRIINYRV